jgi:hypothetical protein
MKGYPYLFTGADKFVLLAPVTSAKAAAEYASKHGMSGYEVKAIREVELGDPPQPVIICRHQTSPEAAETPPAPTEEVAEDAGRKSVGPLDAENDLHGAPDTENFETEEIEE